MCKNSYVIQVSGPREQREKLLGSLIENSANLTREFICRPNACVFYFKYRGDARLVLKKISRQFTENYKTVKDKFCLGEAVATVMKLS